MSLAGHGLATHNRPRTTYFDFMSDFARSRLGVEPTELSKIADYRELFAVLLALLPPRHSPEEKWVKKKINE